MATCTTSASITPSLITREQLTAYKNGGWIELKKDRNKDSLGNVSDVITLKLPITKCDVATAQCKSVRNTVCYSLAAIPLFALSLAGSIMTATFDCITSLPNLEPFYYQEPSTGFVYKASERNQQRQTTEQTDCYACLVLGLNKMFYDTMQPCTCIKPEEQVMEVRVAENLQDSLSLLQPLKKPNEATKLLPKNEQTFSF